MRTTTSRDRDLYRIPATVANVFEMEGPMTRAIPAAEFSRRVSLDVQRVRIHRHLDGRRPIGAHHAVLVVKAFQLKFQVGSPHESLMHLRLQVELVVGYGEIVLEAERLKYRSFPNRKR